MNKFNLEKALAGEKVITRDGREVTQIVSFDASDSEFVVYGVIDGEAIDSWTQDGGYHDTNSEECGADLFMEPVMLSGFINQYSDHTPTWHPTKEEADDDNILDAIGNCIACIDLSKFENGHGLSQ